MNNVESTTVTPPGYSYREGVCARDRRRTTRTGGRYGDYDTTDGPVDEFDE